MSRSTGIAAANSPAMAASTPRTIAMMPPVVGVPSGYVAVT